MSEEPMMEEEEEREEDDDGGGEREAASMMMSRKEKRKEAKKKKRREKRKEMAEKEREEEEAKLNDPEEMKRIELMEQEERERVERERNEFEERERVLLLLLEEKKKKKEDEEEERLRMKLLEDSEIDKKVDDNDEGSDWEYVEGPAEIIWQGNEIIVKKKKVRVPKKVVDQLTGEEVLLRHLQSQDADRPTSNPLPPQSEAFSDYKNASTVSGHEVYENVAQQVPNFGTEQDKSHCPFHIKTGACRFGQRCSRVHFYPDKACTLLIKNMYNGPGLAWEQDEGLEYTDEEVERCYEEFYEDVHTEFLKFGEIMNFKACRNGAFHLRGNVYVHYRSLDSAMSAYQFINGRYFAGKQLTCEFVGVTRWKIAICGEYMKSRFKTCSRGTACNFIHCFRNPGGDYEWADWDKPPPRYWVEKMAALFGYSDEFGCEKPMGHESLGRFRSSNMMITADSDRHRSRVSKSRERDWLSIGSGRSHYDWDGIQKSAHRQKHRSEDRKQIDAIDEKKYEERTNSIGYHHRKRETHDTDSDRDLSGRDKNGGRERDMLDGHAKKSSRQRNKALEFPDDYGDNRNRTGEADSDKDLSDKDTERHAHHGRTRKSSRHRNKVLGAPENHGHKREKTNDTNSGGDWSDRDRDGHKKHRHQKKVSENLDDYNNNENRIVEANKDGDKEARHGRTRKSTRHRHSESGVLDGHGGKRKRAHDTDSDGEWSDRDRGSKKHRTRKSTRSRKQSDYSELVDDNGDTNNNIDSNDHWSDKDRERRHT